MIQQPNVSKGGSTEYNACTINSTFVNGGGFACTGFYSSKSGGDTVHFDSQILSVFECQPGSVRIESAYAYGSTPETWIPVVMIGGIENGKLRLYATYKTG